MFCRIYRARRLQKYGRSCALSVQRRVAYEEEYTMPTIGWADIVGYTCTYCGKWATHWYDDIPICCSCRLGEQDEDMEREAIKMNNDFQRGVPYL